MHFFFEKYCYIKKNNVTLQIEKPKREDIMSQLEPLIADLALILMCAGLMTLLFKSLKQPIVLGYIVAGFLASPNMPYMPSVTDGHSVHLWSEIGVIFLLFALGLEF